MKRAAGDTQQYLHIPSFLMKDSQTFLINHLWLQEANKQCSLMYWNHKCFKCVSFRFEWSLHMCTYASAKACVHFIPCVSKYLRRETKRTFELALCMLLHKPIHGTVDWVANDSRIPNCFISFYLFYCTCSLWLSKFCWINKCTSRLMMIIFSLVHFQFSLSFKPRMSNAICFCVSLRFHVHFLLWQILLSIGWNRSRFDFRPREIDSWFARVKESEAGHIWVIDFLPYSVKSDKINAQNQKFTAQTR